MKEYYSKINQVIFSSFEFLQYATVKINCMLNDGTSASGTGFFYQFSFNDNSSVTVIVTNKHVVADSKIGEISITALNPRGEPNLQDVVKIKIDDFEKSWIKHPENDIDLCIFPTARTFQAFSKIGKNPCFAPFREKEMPDFDNLEIYKPTEDIYMVGYPNGLGDEVHNLPIIRKGITATPFFVNHNGHAEFLVDCACFPGSSGSPVLIVDESSYALHKQPLQAGNRMILLGILYAGPQYDAYGEIKKYVVPTKSYVSTDIPMNLGYCISSRKLLDFIPIIEKLKAQENKN
jgi:hypothetical protein